MQQVWYHNGAVLLAAFSQWPIMVETFVPDTNRSVKVIPWCVNTHFSIRDAILSTLFKELTLFMICCGGL